MYSIYGKNNLLLYVFIEILITITKYYFNINKFTNPKPNFQNEKNICKKFNSDGVRNFNVFIFRFFAAHLR